MKKGITPIVSIIILLLITVALAGAAFTFLQGYLFTYTGSSFRMDSGMVFCVKNASDSNLITAQVTNTGQQALGNNEFSLVQIDGVNVAIPTISLQPGQAGIIIDGNDCGGAVGGCTSGTHTVSVGTAAGVTTVNVYCP
jgi:flagellin-like protein